MKTLCIVLSLVLIFSGCSSLVENNDLTDLPEVIARQNTTESYFSVIRPSIYFIASDSTKLVAEVREIFLAQNDNAAIEIVANLLDGPRNQNLQNPPKLRVIDVEMFSDTTNVYLKTDERLSSESAFYLAVQISDTLIDYFSITYACIFINDEVITIDGIPCGPLKKSGGDVSIAYKEYLARFSDVFTPAYEAMSTDVAIYFVDSEFNYIISEVRQVTFSDKDYVRKLIQELIAGPQIKQYLEPVLKPDAKWLEDMQIVLSDTGEHLFINFNSNPLRYESGDVSAELQLATIFKTVVNCLGTIKRITFKNGYKSYYFSDSVVKQYMGRRISLLFPTESMLAPEPHTVLEMNSRKLEIYVTELFGEPNDLSGFGAKPLCDARLSDEMLISLTLRGTTAVLNFTPEFYELISAMPMKRISLSIFSIINTICQDSRVKTVQFLKNGQSVDKLGEIDLQYPLMPSPGLIRA